MHRQDNPQLIILFLIELDNGNLILNVKSELIHLLQVQKGERCKKLLSVKNPEEAV